MLYVGLKYSLCTTVLRESLLTMLCNVIAVWQWLNIDGIITIIIIVYYGYNSAMAWLA